MKKETIKIYSPKKNKLKNILITEKAIKQILFLVNSNPDNTGIRLGIKKSGCAGFRYTMKLVKNSDIKEKKRHEEVKFFYKKICIYVFCKDIQLLEGIKIDFKKDNINKIFKFYNDKLEKFCGCGESFAIN